MRLAADAPTASASASVAGQPANPATEGKNTVSPVPAFHSLQYLYVDWRFETNRAEIPAS